MSDEEDGGLPEEARNILDQESSVEVSPNTPWRNSLGQLCFQNVDDLYEHGGQIFLRKGESGLVIVIDNEGEDIPYPANKNYWVIRYVDMGEWDTRNNTTDIMPLIDHYSALRHDFGSRWGKEYDQFTRMPEGGIRVDRFEGLPVYVPDPARDDSRPETQSEATTSATTGNTTVTTTTVKPGAAGVVTESETIPGKLSSRFDSKGAAPITQPASPTGEVTSRFDSKGDTPIPLTSSASASVTPGPTTPSSTTSSSASSSAGATATRLSPNVSTGVDPCLPNNPPVTNADGSGATPPSNMPYDDAIIRQARAAAASPASVIPGIGGGRGNGAAEVARRQADATSTAPTTVTQEPSTPTTGQSTTPTNSRPNVYIYEPLEGGFDRYDFNSGKKVFTPNSGGPSMNVSGTSVAPDSTPVTPVDGVIPAGTTTGGPSRLRQRQAALSGGAG